MSTSASRHNSLLPRLGSIANPEYTIEFEAGPASQQPRIRASETTIRWYNDLNTRKVQYLQLCKEGSQYYAVIILEDGSIFQLKFARSRNGGNPGNVCSLFRLYKNSRLLSMCSFSIDGVGDVACPISDVKFLIAICLPLCQRLDPARTSHETLFALTLVTVVARKCVEIKSKHVTGTGTPLDDFWRNIISSTKSANQPLWEEAIVDSIHDQARNWVFLKAREHVAEYLFWHQRELGPASSAEPVGATEIQGSIASASAQSAPSPTRRQIHSATLDERERNSTASIVAWLEFLCPKQVAHSLTLWDATWSSTWEKEWRKAWVESWTKQQGENNLKVVTPARFTDHIPLTTGRVSGKIAGKIPIDTNVMFELMVKMPANSLLEWEYEHTRQFRHCQEDRGTGQWYLGIAAAQGKEVVWFKSWRCLRYPNPLDSWCPSWELAVVMAWVLRWEKAVEAGRNLQVQTSTQRGTSQQRIVAGPVTVSPAGSQEQVSSAAPQTGKRTATTEVELQAPPPKSKYSRNKLVTTTRLLGQMKARYLKRVFEQPNITNQANQVSISSQENPPCLLDKVVDFAWDIALKTPESPESNLSSAAANAFHLAKKNFGSRVNIASRIAALPEGKWELVFKEAWEITWKKCWREAWATVMKEAEKIVSTRGIQEGISCTRDDEDRRLAQQTILSQPSSKPMSKIEPTVILSHDAQASLGTIERKMLHTNLSMDYRRRVPSIFISLEQLYRAMSHSSPVVHPKMEIKMFEEKQSLQAIVYAKSKTKALWDQKPEEESFQVVSHADFQNKVKCIVGDISENFDQPAVQWMAEVWQEAIAISSSIDRDFIPEISEPKNTLRTLPLRAPTYYSSQAADALVSGGESQQLGANQNRDSFISRIFNLRMAEF